MAHPRNLQQLELLIALPVPTLLFLLSNGESVLMDVATYTDTKSHFPDSWR